MAFYFSNASSHPVKDKEVYFLDANIWLIILSPKIKISYREKTYLALFEKIISNSKVRIVLPALVVSEVINRIIREVYYKKHLKKKRTIQPGFEEDRSYYKNVFRSSEEYRIAYNLVCDDIKSYSTSIDLISDEFGTTFKFKHLLKDPPVNLDFNDYYYYRLCKNKGYFLVTDDKDFWIEDIKVVTANKKLLDNYIATLKDPEAEDR